MLDSIRRRQRLIMALIIIFVIPSFIFLGVQGFESNNVSGVAEVGGQPISKESLDREVTQVMELLKERGMKNVESNNPFVRQLALQNLIQRRLLSAESKHLAVTVSEKYLRDQIVKIPGVVKEDGTIDFDAYQNWLSARGLDVQRFEELLSRQIAEQRVGNIWRTPAIMSQAHLKAVSNLLQQERTVRQKVFYKKDYLAKVKVSEKEIKDFYAKNSAQFKTPAKASVQYVVLSKQSLIAATKVSLAEIKARYQQDKSTYSTKEQRTVRHILIAYPNNTPTKKEVAQTLKKAQKVLAKLKPNGSNFAAIAKKSSDDPGSSERGGDLGEITAGMMVKEFDKAAFSLAKGKISKPVKTEFGYHIIEVTSIEAAQVEPLNKVKDAIELALRNQKVAKSFPSKVETFESLAYEKSQSLEPIKKALGLTIATAQNVSQQTPPNNPILANSKVLNALFTTDSIKERNNIPAVEVTPGVWVSARITSYKAAHKQSLETVRDAVIARLKDQKAQAMAVKEGSTLLKALKTSPNQKEFEMATKTYGRYLNSGDSRFTAWVMDMNGTKLPRTIGNTFEDGYVILQLVKASGPLSLSDSQKKSADAEIDRFYSSADERAVMDTIRKKYKVNVSLTNDGKEAP